jgi:mono/diheme cytochrome c family protein
MPRRWFYRTLLFLAAVSAIGIAGLFVWAPRAIPLDPSPRTAFDSALITKGAQLAAIGNCNVCHTRPDGLPYAGGRPIATPFGAVYSTNITPDLQTGVGGWPEAAFVRAMREGVSRDGRHLYPAFPYDHMAKMHDADIRAVYAFVMTRRAVQATSPPNELPFPFNIRALVAGWKLLFLVRGEWQTDPSKSPEWNRGAYLVEGLGHCGACHTPRNLLGAEKGGQSYAGGESAGWMAPALNAASPAAVPWTAERLYAYLRHGSEDLHGTAAGPMAPVVKNLETVPDEDVRAVATYVAAVAGNASGARQAEADKVITRAKRQSSAAIEAAAPRAEDAIYAGACAQCHGEAGRSPTIPALNLSLSSALRMPRPDNVVRIVREGIRPVDGGAGPMMPGFADALTDDQLLTLLGYLRAHFAEQPAWSGVEDAVRRAKADASETPGTTQGTRNP